MQKKLKSKGAGRFQRRSAQAGASPRPAEERRATSSRSKRWFRLLAVEKYVVCWKYL